MKIYPTNKFIGFLFKGIVKTSLLKTKQTYLISFLLLSQVFLLASNFPWDYAVENNKGVKNYHSKNYKEAQVNFEQAYKSAPNNLNIKYNKASTLYQQKKYAESQAIYLGLLKEKNLTSELRQKTYYNLGNTVYRLAEESNYDKLFYDSLNNYQKAIDINPEDKKAKENHEFVKKLLQERIKNQIKNNSSSKNKKNDSKSSGNTQNSNKTNSPVNNQSQQQYNDPINNSMIDKFLNEQKKEELEKQALLNRKYNFDKKNQPTLKKDW